MTHSSRPAVMCSSRWMDGNAVLTMVTSSNVMPCAMHMATRVRRRRRVSRGSSAAVRSDNGWHAVGGGHRDPA